MQDGSPLRHACIVALAQQINSINLSHPVRVAIDGRTASGKTTLANELAHALNVSGRTVIRTSIDGFHRPRAERYAKGRYSSEGYYRDARDLEAMQRLLLVPLGPLGDRLYRTASFDLERDGPIDQAPLLAEPDCILIVDGTFLQRHELSPHWDFVVFVEVSADVAANRAIARDSLTTEGAAVAVRLYRERYLPAFEMYEAECEPIQNAGVIFRNEVLEQPELLTRRRDD